MSLTLPKLVGACLVQSCSISNKLMFKEWTMKIGLHHTGLNWNNLIVLVW